MTLSPTPSCATADCGLKSEPTSASMPAPRMVAAPAGAGRRRRPFVQALMALALSVSMAFAPMSAQAARGDVSEASAIAGSVAMIPLASVAIASVAGAATLSVPAVMLSASAEWLMISARASAQGTVWVLERAVDGARISLTVAGAALAGVVITAGALIVVTPVVSGWVLSEGSRVLAYIPRDEHRSMFFNERL